MGSPPRHRDRSRRATIGDEIRAGGDHQCALVGALPVDHRPHAPDSRSPRGQGLANRWRLHLWQAVVVSKTGAACVAAAVQTSAHEPGALARSAHPARYAPARTGIRIATVSAATARVRDALGRQPRVSLATLPTPLYDAIRLREALGGPSQCPRILIKRDDLTPLGLGGNKARKL